MRWVLIRPLHQSPYYDPEIQEPLGIEVLAACLRADGESVLLLDSAIEGHADARIGRRAASFQPDAVGLSITTAEQIPSVRAIHAECVRALARPVSWIAGGNFVSTEPERAEAMLPSGFCRVRFEGEEALRELRRGWAEGLAPPAGRTLEGRRVADLDALPFPARDFAGHLLGNDWAFNLQGSRGCQGACRYCASPGMAEGNRWRGRSPGNIVAEMADLARRFGARAFNFIDEDFLGPERQAEARAHTFCAALRERRLAVTFGVQVRPGTLSEAVIDDLTDIGLVYVFVGIESDDPLDFQRWHRPWTSDPWRWVHRLRTRGAEVGAGVLLFHSHSTLAGIRRFAGTLRQHRLLDHRSAINRLDAMPGSVFHRAAMRSGQVAPDATGAQPLPFVHPEVGALYDDLVTALAPLGPPSMHAICSLPPLLSRRRRAPDFADKRAALGAINETLDAATARILFALLDTHQAGTVPPPDHAALRAAALACGVQAARELARAGFAPSFEMLREAIRIDSGL